MAPIVAPPLAPVRKKLVRRAQPDRSQALRRAMQLIFLALNVWIGVEFYLFVRYYETGGRSLWAGRPPGVEGWLPIASMMNLKVLLLSGANAGPAPRRNVPTDRFSLRLLDLSQELLRLALPRRDHLRVPLAPRPPDLRPQFPSPAKARHRPAQPEVPPPRSLRVRRRSPCPSPPSEPFWKAPTASWTT